MDREELKFVIVLSLFLLLLIVLFYDGLTVKEYPTGKTVPCYDEKRNIILGLSCKEKLHGGR